MNSNSRRLRFTVEERIFEGVVGGTISLTAMTYASEIADTSHRGSFVSVNIIMLLLGIVGGAALGLIFTWILQSAGINSDLEVWTAVILLVPVGGSILQTLLIDRLGRRLCLIVSLAPSTVFCFSLGVFSYLYNQVEPNGYNVLHASNGSGFNETGQVDTG
ncbi:hypothetical protein Pmani_004026 [Petrolisthes manimaculis]|uniref:Major facilitator superfamily (MFS) profile domain-containing protein n=1 Tax=Petrolisthes manimaculis TaxID=1843537 RepID=A0AAE1QFP0_9EUCA|nr:hypothetical protein Pmani_004026 [Petrolisthes manimaculis]